MIKVILSDLARTFLFVKDKSWTDTLNNLNAKLELEDPNYSFFDYFELDYSYIDLMKSLKKKYKVAMFTSGRIQNHIELFPILEPIFEIIFNEESVGYKKNEGGAYSVISNRLSVLPEEILFIDDDMKFGEAARNVGINVHQMNSTDSLREFLKLNKFI